MRDTKQDFVVAECLQELKKSVPGLLILDIWLKDNEWMVLTY